MIAILTDFGVQGPYLGQMHAVLAERAPGTPLVDIFPDLPRFDARAAAYLVPAYTQYLPPNTICLCVVDPGVGSDRRAVALKADGLWYVGPDNGLFSILIRRASRVRAFIVRWVPERLSASFHGRDLFAPIAAGLARGEEPPGEPLAADALVSPAWPEELAEVVYLDHYGNALTGIRASSVGRDARVRVAGRECCFRRTFAEAEAGELFWYENSNGLLELATNRGSAALELGLAPGTPVEPP
ncbi:MAG: SAM-dependent chlorinase/fluorinase [Gammaproteobacteria bacterium]|jgi:hypothetical protein